MSYKRSRQAFESDLQRQESPYVFYGTPLPPLDERVRDDGSFVPVWKQEVTDDRGRKRLHGAFTGGYSAGYFNTVGSKEGWSPSTFVSSRQKAKDGQTQNREQRVEDFMDEEDMREAEESQSLQTSESFAGFGTANDPMHRGSVMDIFRPSGESVGEKLLKRMGWKAGQGIGPHVKREADLGEGQVSHGKIHTFAPSDVPLVIFTQKSDRKGLGYGTSESSIIDKFGSSSARQQKRLVVADEDGSDNDTGALFSAQPRTKPTESRKGGFGVGVLNDTGSDDEDPYSMGPKISYNKTIGSEKPSKASRPSKKRTTNPALQKKPIFLSRKLGGLSTALRKCQDGTLPLDGFVLADSVNEMSKLSLKSEKYKPPEVPTGWKSSLATGDQSGPATEHMTVAEMAKASMHSSKTRASALGEAQLPGKSVFDFLSPAARDRLAAASGKSDLPQGLGQIPDGYTSRKDTGKDLQDYVPKLDQDVALLALKRSTEPSGGWMPYAEDLQKRDRYKIFLEIRAGLRPTEQGDELPPRASGMKQEDWVQELQEFSRAAEVFQPVSGLMASRFTSAASSRTEESADGNNPDTTPLLTHKRSKPEDPAVAAAKVGMFGHLTRSTANFYPTRLLCKRFGVAMPEISNREDHSAEGGANIPAQSATARVSDHSASLQREAASQTAAASQPEPDTVTPNLNAIDPDRNEVLEQAKPSMDLFRAVFGSDDEDDD